MLDDQQIVRSATVQVGGVLPLGVQRIGGDDRIGDLDAVQQGGEQGDLIGLGAHVYLAKHHAMAMIEGSEQVTAAFAAVPRPA